MPTEPDRPQPTARQWTAARSAAALRAIGRAARIATARIATESVGIRMAPATAAIERVAAAAQAAIRRGPGRPPGSKEKYPTPESYAEAIRELPDRARRSGWKLSDASDTRLAKWLRVSKPTADARNDEYGVTYDDMRRQRR